MSVNEKYNFDPLAINLPNDNDIFVNSDLSQSLPELIARFQSNIHEEIFSVSGNQILFSLEELPEYLIQRQNCSQGIIVQLYNLQKNSERRVQISDNFEIHKSTSTPVKFLSTGSNDLDTTGSPLRCPFAVNNEDAEFKPLMLNIISPKNKISNSLPSFKGLPLNLARNLSSKLFSALKVTSSQNIITCPIWIACDAQDVQHTLFLGINHEDLTTLINVTSSGPHVGLENLPTIDHLTYHFCFACPTRRAECSVEALYDVFSSEDNAGSTVHLSSSWKRPLSILSSPSLDACTTTQVHIDISDVRSDAYQIYFELATLEGFILGLETCEVNWLKRKDELPVINQLQQYFNSIIEKAFFSAEKQKIEDDCAANFDKILEAKFFQVRQNMEFTEKLWTIFIQCESICELQEGLNCVFEAITAGVMRPPILVKNKTQVAEISRNLMRGIIKKVDLVGLAPLEMLIEIGLEKIKRDYINIFQVCELATVEQLLPFINWTLSKGLYQNCLNKLMQMHIALQVVVVLRKYMKLPASILTQCTAQVLVELVEKEGQKDFVFPLQTSLIANLFKNLSPAMWKLNMSCQTESFLKSMNFYIKRDFDFFSSNNATNNIDFNLSLDEKESKDWINYFCLAITSTRDEFVM